MESESLQKISPSTSVLRYSHATPKRTFTPRLSPVQSPEDKKGRSTPLCRNPFDVKAESLYFPACSPSVFAQLQPNKEKDGTFRWSIEKLSVLYPADIDESTAPDPWADTEQELHAQKAIDAFFSQNSIVPSPWSSSPKQGSAARIRRRGYASSVFSNVQSCDATTQTMMSIPPDVDLRKILGNFFTFENDESISSDNSSEEVDFMSTSSLRRKLFVDEAAKSPCNSRKESGDLNFAKRRNTPSLSIKSVFSTPSDLLSSSPITPPTCSDACNIFESPTLSPIVPDSHRRVCNSINEQDSEDVNQSKREETSSVNPQESMSFCLESQESIPFPSYTSERQDTGYASGSISSSQNFTSSEIHFGALSRITPVAELMEDIELSSHSMSCDISYKNDSKSVKPVPTTDWKGPESRSCDFKSCPWVPGCCSTPAPCLDS